MTGPSTDGLVDWTSMTDAVARLKATIEALERDLAACQQGSLAIAKAANEATAALQRSNAKMREALEFYASGIGHREIEDGGAIARKALSHSSEASDG